MRMRRAARSAWSFRPGARVIALLFVLAALDVPTAVVEAQRETAPVGVSNYTRVDATVACAKATAARVGLKYIHLPHRTPTPEIAEAFLELNPDAII